MITTTTTWRQTVTATVRNSILVGGFILLVGCSEPAPETAAASATNTATPQVALIMKSLANEFFVNMREAAQQHHGEHSDQYQLIVNGIKNESDLAAQVALVDQMIARGVDAMVIAPADSKALVPALARAVNQGIHVVNIDNQLDADVLAEYGINIPFIGPSNREGARLVADHVLGQLPPDSKVFVLEGIPTAFNAQERAAGFNEMIEKYGMQRVASQSAAWDQTRAAEITAAVLTRFADIDVILAANDSMALGAASAVSLAGRDDIVIAGFDNISAIHPLLQNGSVLATLDQFGDQFAIYGIEFALEMISGRATISHQQTPVKLITAADLE